MPRRREVPKRKIIPDPKYKDKLVSKFTNTLMFDGEKAVAEGILYGSFDVISELVNLATSLSLYFGSGVILRFGTSLRRGIAISS